MRTPTVARTIVPIQGRPVDACRASSAVSIHPTGLCPPQALSGGGVSTALERAEAQDPTLRERGAEAEGGQVARWRCRQRGLRRLHHRCRRVGRRCRRIPRRRVDDLGSRPGREDLASGRGKHGAARRGAAWRGVRSRARVRALVGEGERRTRLLAKERVERRGGSCG